jgi:hypothetical protein
LPKEPRENKFKMEALRIRSAAVAALRGLPSGENFHGYLEPPVTADPANPLEVWGRQILAIAQCLRMMIRYLENHVVSLLQCVGEWLIEMA